MQKKKKKNSGKYYSQVLAEEYYFQVPENTSEAIRESLKNANSH